MARKLLKKQIALLDKILKSRNLWVYDDLTSEEQSSLEKINYWETIHQAAERYIIDYQFKERNKRW